MREAQFSASVYCGGGSARQRGPLGKGATDQICRLKVDEKRGRRQSETDEDLQSEPVNQIRVDTEADSGREKADSLLSFSVDEIRESDDAGENSLGCHVQTYTFVESWVRQANF